MAHRCGRKVGGVCAAFYENTSESWWALFKIEPYQDGLVITLVSIEVEIERLLLDVDVLHPHIGVDWIRDSGELYLAGDWLAQCGLTGQSLAFSVMLGKVVIRVQQRNALA